MDPYSFSLGHGVESWKCLSGFPIPFCNAMGSGDSGKVDEECAPLGKKGVILDFPLLGMICGWVCLLQFHFGTMK